MTSQLVLRQLLLDELADLELYQALRRRAKYRLADVLDGFIETEKRHAAFWRQKSGFSDVSASWQGKMRNAVLRFAVALFGEAIAYIVLEAVEVHGVKKYISLWERVTDPAIRDGLRTILTEELQHEDEALMSGRSRSIRPETIRNAFLGFNDGSVEILGAVSGFAAAFSDTRLIVVSGLTVSVAGALSMAAGAFLSTHSEREVQQLERGKQRFLSPSEIHDEQIVSSPWAAAALVGCSYLVGAAVPVAPFIFGAHQAYWSVLFSGGLILVVSAALAFLSGMGVAKRVVLNSLVLFAAVGISYVVGLCANYFFGI